MGTHIAAPRPTSSEPVDEKHVVQKVTRRVIPFVFVLYIVNYIDRANVGYASLQMNRELGLTSQTFGLAAGLFFIGYFLFEVPSNMALARFGARRWIARILVSWGMLATLLGFVHNPTQLVIVRFLLGIAEAGFFPGIIIHLSKWFRRQDLATATALFTASIPVSYIIAAPLSTAIMSSVRWFGLSGWRWMFVLEGIPALLLGVACYWMLDEDPRRATWLEPAERDWLAGELEREESSRSDVEHLSVLRTLANPRVLLLGAIYFVYQVGSLGTGYWLPQIIKGLGHSLTTFQVGLVAMVPYAFATICMVFWSRHSDRRQERKAHCWIPMAVSAVAMFAAAATRQPVLAIAAMSIALAGLYSFKSPFWSVPGLFLGTSTAGTAVAAINSVGNLGGFVGPYAQGMIVDRTGSAQSGLWFFGALLVVATIMMALVRVRAPEERVLETPVAPVVGAGRA